jgi:two-component system CAI-1 autoinducer sensor kinase/phosphatase CqsS
MYSIIPAVVAVFFLIYGIYVIKSKGLNRITIAFCILALATFFWQFSWAVLFQMDEPEMAGGIIKIGWLLILFLPTSLYHFLIEITRRSDDLPYVYFSYFIASILLVALITSDTIIDGQYEYFFGFYPKAGVLHPLHILQTCVVVTRGLYITYRKYMVVQAEEKTKLGYAVIGIIIYFFAAIDYLCNYGVEFYPFGVFFITVSLGIIAYTTTQYDIMDDSKIIASAIAHEMKTPMATLRNQSELLSQFLPELIANYSPPKTSNGLDPNLLSGLTGISKSLEKEAKSLNQGVNMLLAMSSYAYLSNKDFNEFYVKECIDEAINRMPDKEYLLDTIHIIVDDNFKIFASYEFFILIIANIVKNSCDAISKNSDDKITIHLYRTSKHKVIDIMDTGCGIESGILPHIFDKFFTTKKRGINSGVGLTFSKSVMHSFGGQLICKSTLGVDTTFTLSFKDD